MSKADIIRLWSVLAVGWLAVAFQLSATWAGEAEDEREEKLRRARQDPFANVPPEFNPTTRRGEFYNPAEWLRPGVRLDFSQYMVQDEAGEVLGYLSLDVTLEHDSVLGDFVHLVKTRNYSGRGFVDVLSYSETFKPRRVERRDEIVADEPGGSGTLLLEQMPGMIVEYLFDRVNVELHERGTSTYTEFRQLPSSFDAEQLVLIVRQLDFLNVEWPFEAYITNPREEDSLPFSITKPVRVQQLSAEPAEYRCFEINARLGNQQLTYWVERTPPYRLVKFIEREHTFTLVQYLEHE